MNVRVMVYHQEAQGLASSGLKRFGYQEVEGPNVWGLGFGFTRA